MDGAVAVFRCNTFGCGMGRYTGGAAGDFFIIASLVLAEED
jgi:hypothetical protein